MKLVFEKEESGCSVRVYPFSAMAFCNVSRLTSSSHFTRSSSFDLLTCTLCTPGSLRRFRSIKISQLLQVIPRTLALSSFMVSDAPHDDRKDRLKHLINVRVKLVSGT